MFIADKKLSECIQFCKQRAIRRLKDCTQEPSNTQIAKLEIALKIGEAELSALSITFVEHRKFHQEIADALQEVRAKHKSLEAGAKKAEKEQKTAPGPTDQIIKNLRAVIEFDLDDLTKCDLAVEYISAAAEYLETHRQKMEQAA